MSRNHSLRIKKFDYDQINEGKLKIIIRVGYSKIRKIKFGDTLTFSDYSEKSFWVKRTTRYKNFVEMIEYENIQEVMPNASSKYKALDILQAIYTEDEEKMGVYVIEIGSEVEEQKVKILKASNYLKDNHEMFSNIVAKTYNVTEEIYKDYQTTNHFSWYWEKNVPGIIKKKADIIVASLNKKIVGIVLLKKEEKEIHTIFVLEEYRRQGIATMLLEETFKILGTTSPVITIPDYSMDQFSTLIKKYHWRQTRMYYYNSQEFVFNGKIS